MAALFPAMLTGARRKGRGLLPPRTILVDQGYAKWLVELAKRWFNYTIEIVNRPAAQREFVVQPQRWKVERTFGWFNWNRLLSKEFERTTESSESDLYLAFIRLMLRRITVPPK
jgi:transposase